MNAHLELPDKGRAIKGLVVYNNWDLEPLDLLNSLTLGCYQPSPEVLRTHHSESLSACQIIYSKVKSLCHKHLKLAVFDNKLDLFKLEQITFFCFIRIIHLTLVITRKNLGTLL